MPKLVRTLIVIAAALVGGLSLYGVTMPLTDSWNENAAALWSWFLIGLAGFAAYRWLPRGDLRHVYLVLAAIVASVVTAMAVTWLLVLAVALPVEGGPVGTVLLLGAADAILAFVIFLPVYVFGNRRWLLVTLGALIPAATAFVLLPPGTDGTYLDATMATAAVLAVIGVAGAVAFSAVLKTGDPSATSELPKDDP